MQLFSSTIANYIPQIQAEITHEACFMQISKSS